MLVSLSIIKNIEAILFFFTVSLHWCLICRAQKQVADTGAPCIGISYGQVAATAAQCWVSLSIIENIEARLFFFTVSLHRWLICRDQKQGADTGAPCAGIS